MLEELTLSNVYQEMPVTNIIDIFFCLENVPYLLRTLKVSELYKPIDVYHKLNQRCNYCGSKEYGGYCAALDSQSENLFRRLIEHPSIRLEWLYLPYKERMK